MINPNWIFGFFQKKNPNWIFGFFQTKNFEEISKKSDKLLVFSFLISKEIFPYTIQVKLTFGDAFCFIAHCSFSSHLQHLHSKAVRSCEVRTASYECFVDRFFINGPRYLLHYHITVSLIYFLRHIFQMQLFNNPLLSNKQKLLSS